ncbi:hypothetical protein N9H78_01360 [Winogradskyella sp.]|nr:hypothetical protein [Winogradskyella sp.]MDA8874300.1 hypothetical protein [Winogradskyella sp.]
MTSQYKANKVYVLYFVLAFIICLSLNFGILKDYIFLDANEYLYTATRNSNFHYEFIQGGRPLLGFWCEYLYGYVCNTISDLKWVRLFALSVSVLFSSQIFRYLLKLNLKIYESALFSILILTLPTFTVYYGWSATAEIPVLLILNFYAGQLLLKALTKTKNRILHFFFAFTIIFTSLFIYQSVVMVFLLPIVFIGVIKNEFKIRIWLQILLFTLICFLAYFISFKIMLNYTDLEATTRSSLSIIDLPKKVIKFHLIEVITLIKGSGFLVASIVSFIIGLFAFSGFFIKQYIKNKSILSSLIISLIIAFSYAPNILSGQSYFSLRTIAPTAIIVLFYQFYFFRELSIKNTLFKKTILIIPIILLAYSSHNLNNYIAEVQNKEYKTAKTVFLKVDINKTNQITFIRPEYGFLQKNEVLKNGFSGEFGNLSSVKDWALPNLFSQVVWENSTSTDKTEEIFSPKNILVTTEENYIPSENNTTVINFVTIFKGAFKN